MADPNNQAARVATRTLKPGEVLLKPGDKLRSVYLIQSGRISLCQSKNGKVVEIAQLSGGQSIGDEAVFGPAQWQLTALALRDSVVVDVPLEALAEPMAQAPAPLKMLVKALADRLRTSSGELKTLKLNRDAVPCPPDNVAKVFGVIYHVARILGAAGAQGASLDEQKGTASLDWDELRKFSLEVFEEPVARLEEAVNILVKLGYARFENRQLCLTDLKQVEAFFDYYGSYHFKGGYDDLLKTNSKMQKITEELLKIAEQYPMDRGGNAHLPYKATIDGMKKSMGTSFEADQLFRLEQKGLFIKRTTTQDGGTLSFYRPDFEQMMLNWKVLKELELWNERGFVDMTEDPAATSDGSAVNPAEERKKWAKALEAWKPVGFVAAGAPKIRTDEKPKPGEIWCSVCMSVVGQNQKTCLVCGAEQPPKAA